MASSTVISGGPCVFPSNLNSGTKNSSHRRQFISLLRSSKHIKQVLSLHSKIIRLAYEQDPFVIFELIRVCSKLDSIDYACKVFKYTRDPNVYIYTALIDGYVSSGFYIDGIFLYYCMIYDLVLPDNYVITSVLKACGHESALTQCRGIHCQILKLGFGSNRSIRMKLMETYGRCGVLDDTRKLFDEMPEKDASASTILISYYSENGQVKEAKNIFNAVRIKDTICWTAMIHGFVRNGKMNQALCLFRRMQLEDSRPNEFTIVCVLSACSYLGALELGRWLHSYIENHAMELNLFVGNALISMYSKCGDIMEGKKVFEEMRNKDVVSYNTMISGLAMHGMSVEAVRLFREMLSLGLNPTPSTFVSVLNACSNGGLVDVGFDIFHCMDRDFGFEPQIEHYGCMVDLLCRVGQLKEAYSFIENMEIEPDHIILCSFLSACKIHGNFELAQKVAKSLLDSDNADPAIYVLMSNIYASSGKFNEAAKVRAKMKDLGVEKEPGCSSIEVNNEIHEFLLGDIKHPQREEIYRKLRDMNQRLRLEGYEPDVEVVLHDIEDSEKEFALAIHSERLAICYGLISTEPHTTLRVVKNLRVCNDCRSVIKFVSKVTGREIVVRDRKRFHHFENGACSCEDFW